MFVEGGHPEQVKALRRMSLQQRLDLALAGIESAGELRRAMIRTNHPDWSTEQVEQALRGEVRNARSVCRKRGGLARLARGLDPLQ